MCGIAGIFNFGSRAPVDPTVLRGMAGAIRHRGPDDEGFHVDGDMGLGFRRLSIIDIAGGHQPMSDEGGNVWVAFNGEIYNYRELRRELEGRGHRFRTNSDTEVIVHGYKAWGADVLNRLNGMFGLAIWDRAARRLTLARDAAGIKLVYYRVERGQLLFASEIRGVLAALPEPPRLDLAALGQFLRYRYTPSPLTLHAGLRKLAPGTMAVFDANGWQVRRWHRSDAHRHPPGLSLADAREELLAIYRRAIERHLISDVPVGLLLSGGLDSGLLLGLMAERGSGWPTFTVGYGRDNYRDDELAEAAETARLYGARHTAVSLTRDVFEDNLAAIVGMVEEPIAASSIVPMFFVCGRASQDVKVALMGQGPDELFGGYNRHLGIHYGAHWRWLPAAVRGGLAAGIERLPRSATLKRGIQALGHPDPGARHLNTFSLLPDAAMRALLRDPGAVDAGPQPLADLCYEFAAERADRDELGAFQLLELRSTLPDELLMYADKLSMAHGLEVRVPYLDREVLAFVEMLPASLKVRRGVRKWLHREVCRRFLPRPVLRRKKRGFAVNVVDGWFRSALGGRIDGYLLDPGALMFEVVRPETVRGLLADHRAGRADNHKILFSLVVLEEWLRGRQTATRALEVA